MKKSVSLNIYGRVQNVGFRYYTQKKARELGIHGFVKNMPDGSVYAEAEGNPEDVDQLIDYCKSGPDWARVDDMNIQDAPVQGHSGFEVR